MCKTDTASAASCSQKGTTGCVGTCVSGKLATSERLAAAVALLRSPAGRAATTRMPQAIQEALELLAVNTKLSLRVASTTPGQAPIQFRRIKTRADDGPISGAEVTQRMVDICGCQGRYDCDCVGCENMARQQLWYRHNAGHEDPERYQRQAAAA